MSDIEDGEVIVDPISKKLRLNLCNMCNHADFKYTCPGCMTKTCSLNCCKQHKSKFNCEGTRNQAQQISLRDYTLNEMWRDYELLNQTMSKSELIQKRLVGITALPDALRYKLLKQQARKQLKVDVRLAPKIMKRHRENISFYSVKDKQIYWCIELVVYLGATDSFRHMTQPINQQRILKDIIIAENLFDANTLAGHSINLQDLDSYFQTNQVHLYWKTHPVVEFSDQVEYQFKSQKKKFRRQQQQDVETSVCQILFLFFFKQERFWTKIDSNTKIADMLENSTVYEFPTINIVFEQFLTQFLN